MARSRSPSEKSPPEISPHVVPVLLAGFGLWCFYDGWISQAAEMQDHLLFNRIASAVLLPWAVWDFLRVRKTKNKEQGAEASPDTRESS